MEAVPVWPVMKRHREILALTLLLIFGLVPRLVLISRFPTIPFSDFHRLVAFGLQLHNNGLTASSPHWDNFSPGLPLVLATLFTVLPHADPAAVARIGTALVCGLLPLLPFLIWRGALPFWLRVVAGIAFALWPGQVLFSGVVAQDNWVLLPSVALGALAVRQMVTRERPRFIIAGLLYAAAFTAREEMLVVLLPVFIAAVGVRLGSGWRRTTAAALAAAIPVLALAAYRKAATGRFALTTGHGGLAILGAYIPGATINYWSDPLPFIASVRPELLHDKAALYAEGSRMAWREALRRPGFQALRILSAVMTFARTGEAASQYWSLGAPEALPESIRARGDALANRARVPLYIEMTAIHALFLAALIVGIRRRSVPILVLSLPVLLKYALHAVTIPQARYLFAATAFEIVAILVAAFEFRSSALPGKWRVVTPALVAGLVFGSGILLFAPRLTAFVQSHDSDPQRVYRFQLQPSDGGAALACTVDKGLLTRLTVDAPQSATIRLRSRDPLPGDATAASCVLTGSGSPRPLFLELFDPYSLGGFPGRMLQDVAVDGVEIYSHDVARDAGSGWAAIPLGPVGAGTSKRVVIGLTAVQPDSGWAWGDAVYTAFQLSRSMSINP
jgi:hypothetical protein